MHRDGSRVVAIARLAVQVQTVVDADAAKARFATVELEAGDRASHQGDG
jgi:hypothetical protein